MAGNYPENDCAKLQQKGRPHKANGQAKQSLTTEFNQKFIRIGL
jgi:hypothetical protein